MKCEDNINAIFMKICIALDHFGLLTYAGMQDNNAFDVSEYKNKVADEEVIEDGGEEMRNC